MNDQNQLFSNQKEVLGIIQSRKQTGHIEKSTVIREKKPEEVYKLSNGWDFYSIGNIKTNDRPEENISVNDSSEGVKRLPVRWFSPRSIGMNNK